MALDKIGVAGAGLMGSEIALVFALDGRKTGREPDADFYVAINAWKEALSFAIPPSPSTREWRRVVDTAKASPDDIVPEHDAPSVASGASEVLAPFSLIVLISVP